LIVNNVLANKHCKAFKHYVELYSGQEKGSAHGKDGTEREGIIAEIRDESYGVGERIFHPDVSVAWHQFRGAAVFG
jgi:hypothetical protein